MKTPTLTIEFPPGVLNARERLARLSGMTPEQFLATSAAEKAGVVTSDQNYLGERGARADLDWFDRFMARQGGEAPSPEDATAGGA